MSHHILHLRCEVCGRLYKPEEPKYPPYWQRTLCAACIEAGHSVERPEREQKLSVPQPRGEGLRQRVLRLLGQ